MATQTEIKYFQQLKQLATLVREDVDSSVVPLVKQLAPEYAQDSTYVETWVDGYNTPGYDAEGEFITTSHDGYWKGNYVWDAWSDRIIGAIQALTNRWVGLFARQQAERIASSFVQSAAGDNSRKNKSFAINLYGGNTELQDYLTAAAYQNSRLIQSIPSQYLEQVQNIVMSNMRNGLRPSYIEEQLTKQFGITERRAKLIARDQHAKIQGDMNRIRQTNSGIEYFKWVTAHDERVRHSHEEVAKRDVGFGEGVFKWSDLPVVDGVKTFPGQPINCRCVARPVTAAAVERYKADLFNRKRRQSTKE